jgi:hypothetical protein
LSAGKTYIQVIIQNFLINTGQADNLNNPLGNNGVWLEQDETNESDSPVLPSPLFKLLFDFN